MVLMLLLLCRCTHKVLLTGTPLQNNISELFMLLHFLEKDKFASVEQFEQQFSDLGQEGQVCCAIKIITLSN
jgi:SNF2 family DNA or RNA helicase